MIFETHAHYDDEKFDADRVELLSHLLRENGIEKVVNVGATLRGCKASVTLAEAYDNVYAAVGIHPEEIDEINEDVMNYLSKISSHPKVVAIGEIGLDYHYTKENRDRQIDLFCKQIEIALANNKPIVVHSRDAISDTYDIIKRYGYGNRTLIHCFSSSLEMALEFIKLGCILGIGGVLTFKNSHRLKRVVSGVSLDNLVLETDSPYMTPVPFRCKRNEPYNIVYVAQEISNLTGVDYSDVLKITSQTACKFFDISL